MSCAFYTVLAAGNFLAEAGRTMLNCEDMVNGIEDEPDRLWSGHKHAEALRETLYKKIDDLDRKGTHYGTEPTLKVWTREMWDELSQNLDPD